MKITDMAAYIGYFKDIDNNSFQIEIQTSGNTSTPTEVFLGPNPIVVKYDTSDTPFDPIRTSTATIEVVNDDYLEDIMTSHAKGTTIKLKNNTTNTYEWVGYLRPRIYDGSYVNDYETIEFEGCDSLSTLQYIDYTDNTAYTKSIVTIKSILDKICDACGLVEGYYWPLTKSVNSTTLLPSALKISEQNFFSSDTNEPWTLQEVLEEIARYVGYTAIQFKESIYFVDYQAYHNANSITYAHYTKASNYARQSDVTLGGIYTVSASTYRGSGASISFDPVYDKVTVNDSLYECEYFLPEIFADENLTNRIESSNFYTYTSVTPPEPYKAQYPYKFKANGDVLTMDDVPDDGDYTTRQGDIDYTYTHRIYDNKYYESVYYTESGTSTTPSVQELKSSAITANYMGGTIIDLGVVRNEYISEYQQTIVANKQDYTRYLCLSDCYNEYSYPSGSHTLFKLKSGYHPLCFMANNSYLVINYSIIWERYIHRPYINPDWRTDACGEVVAGDVTRNIGNLNFKLRIGDKYWNGKQWKTGTTQTFKVVCEKTSKQKDVWNTELKTLNNVEWDLNVNAEGYKIPLNGIDQMGEITFEILRPSPQFMLTSSYGSRAIKHYEYNAYTWVKDLTIKCVQGGQDIEKEESDIVYTNDIDTNSVNEMDEIKCKITTYTTMTKPSYSHMIYYDGTNNSLLTAVTETALSGVAQKPEENIVEKYVNQYNTPTKQITATLKKDITPFHLVKGIDVDAPNSGFVVLGGEYDYAYNRQEITLVNKK